MSSHAEGTEVAGLGNGVAARKPMAPLPSKRPAKEVTKKKPRQFRSRKPKDMPRRPLSAYNIFFKEERARLLAERQALGAAAGEKIGFEKMAKTIGKRWKELSAEELGRFKLLAKDDTERYRREMDAYNHDLAMKGRRDREELSRKRMEEAAMQSQSQAGLPSLGAAPNLSTASFALPSQATQHNLPNDISLASAQLPSQQQQSSSVSAQLNQMLAAGSSLPTIQGLRNILGGQPQRTNPFQEALLQLGNLGQQQNQQSLQDQIRHHQQQNQARLEDQLRQQQQQQLQQQQQSQSRLEEQLRQNLLSRAAANPGLMAALPPSLQQQLLVHSLQARLASSSAANPDP